MALASNRAASQIVVVANQCAPSPLSKALPPELKSLWSVALHGGILAHPEVIMSKGIKGAATAYLAATGIQRTIFLSVEFVEHHPAFAKIVQDVCRAAGSKWKINPDFSNFDMGKKSTQRIAIVLVKQKRKDNCHI